MRHLLKGSTWVLCSLVAVLLLANSGFARAQGNSGGTCVATGGEAVTPEKLNFSPGQTASYSGSGFAASCGVRVDFSGPGDNAPGRIVNTDRWGNLSFTQGLGKALGKYRADLTGKGGAALDSVTVTADTLESGPSVPLPGPSVFTGNFGTADHGAGFSSSLIIPNNGTATGAAAGTTVIVAFSSGPAGGGGPVSSCSDTQGNTYALDVNLPSASNTRALAICSSRIVLPLGAADTITVHFPTNGNTQHATANVFNGLSLAPALDKTHTASGASNAPNSGNTATTSQASELLVGAFTFNGTNANTFSAGAGYALTNPSQGAGSGAGLGSEWQVVSSTGAYAANGTLSVATAWLGAIATYKIGLPATHFSVSAPSSVLAGQAFSVTVTALDQNNNIATGYTGTVHFTTSDTSFSVILPADYAFAPLDLGVHTFTNQVTLATAGNQTITATDTSNASITGSTSVQVNAGTATHFGVTAPANATSGIAFNFTVTAKDVFNNTVTGYGGTVHFTSTDPLAVLPADSTLTLGTKTFSATLKTVGGQTLTATDTANSAITGTSNSVTVAPHFAVSAPGTATAGSAFNFTVTAQDGSNATITGYAGTVQFASSDGEAILPSNYTFAPGGDLGTHTFSATLKTAGNQTISVSDTANGFMAGTSNTIAVAPGPLGTFMVHYGGPNPKVGQPAGFDTRALDTFGNFKTNYTGTVHFHSSDSTAFLPADYTFVPGDQGHQVFFVTFHTTGTQTFEVFDNATGIQGEDHVTVDP